MCDATIMATTTYAQHYILQYYNWLLVIKEPET